MSHRTYTSATCSRPSVVNMHILWTVSDSRECLTGYLSVMACAHEDVDFDALASASLPLMEAQLSGQDSLSLCHM